MGDKHTTCDKALLQRTHARTCELFFFWLLCSKRDDDADAYSYCDPCDVVRWWQEESCWRKEPAKKVQKRRTPSKNESKVLDLDIGGFFNPDKYKDGAKAGGSDLAPAQKSVGYRFTGASGSAPDVDSQGKKARLGGVVYQFANKYGGNIDEYSPIWTPETRQPGADVYEPG